MSWEKRKDELREETARTYNKKKSTARWCKGKVGREHVTEIVLNHNYSNRKACMWYPIYYSFARRDEGPKDYRYWCQHSVKCTVCGKYVEYFLKPEQCPTFQPKPIQN
ncbi:MAG TPA: hypothetical protein VJ617_19950 [Arthrobacter sp.]|nr:hypothetical protein [Arthrobacter sp.]